MGNLVQDTKKTRNHTLDFLKLLSSFMIVCIHFKFPGTLGELVTVFSRFAVPVFFMISGYYSYHDGGEKLGKKLLHIVKLYVGAVVLYGCFNIAVKLFAGQYKEAIWYVSTYFRIKYIAPFLLFNESNTAMHLWFLGSLIYVYAIRYVVVKTNIGDRAVYLFSGILLAIHLVLGIGLSVLGIEPPEFLLRHYVLRNFLFMGFPLFSLGQLIRKKEDAILSKVTNTHVALLTAICVIEAFVMHRIDWVKDLYLGSVLLAFALFVVALKGKDKPFPTKATALLRTSTNVYLIHVMVGDLLSVTPLETVQVYLWLKPVAIFLVSVLLSLAIDRGLQKIQSQTSRV